jgi:lipoyl(octanoyl) transferase
MKFENLRLIQDENPKMASLNMAIDEALFLTAESPVIRFYRWAHPSISFGYFTAWSEVYPRFAERDLVRRWTGGGIVEHGQDLTYSLVYPGGRELPAAIEVYRLVHAAIAKVLAGTGRPIEIAKSNETGASPACFDKAVQYDVKFNGVKIAGAAIRRNRQGLLLQGSIQRCEIPGQFDVLFAGELCNRLELTLLPDRIVSLAKCLAKEKYGTEEWNHRS